MQRTAFGRRRHSRPRPGHAFLVERMEPRLLLAVVTVTSTNDAGPGSLRQAILDANAAPGADQVRFNIPGNAITNTIQPLSPLPAVMDSLDIQGRSQPGTDPYWQPIRLNGQFAGPTAVGLRVTGRGSHVTGLRIDGFGSHGLVLEGGGEHIIEGNAIGSDIVGGITYPGNGGSGIVIINSAGTYVGNPYNSTANMNTICGNGGWGMEIRGADSRQNGISYNFIGLTRYNDVIGNTLGGVLFDGAPENSIGSVIGSSSVVVVSGNGGPGVKITGSGARGNVIGAVNIGFGVTADATYAEIFRVIGNAGEGVLINGGARDNIVQGSYIGGNVGGGVVISDADTTGNALEGNKIGTDFGGTAAVGNGPAGAGVVLRAPGNRIGTDTSDVLTRNVIAYNAGGGVIIQGNSTGGTPPAGNTIAGNSIHSNGGLGIDLRGDGVTPNDALDADRGPNDLQNYPVITSAGRVLIPNEFPQFPPGRGTRVQGTLNSTPNTTFRVQFFSGPGDPSGFGEGKTFLGSAEVRTDASGNATFDEALPARELGPGPAAPGEFVTATATAPDGGTSEFSNAKLVPGIVDRHIFYNGSSYDGGDLAATPADDNAIAPNIRVVLPRGFASQGAYTTYYKGINGIMADMVGLPAGSVLTAADFRVRVPNPNAGDPGYVDSWLPGPAPTQVTVRPGAGTGGSDRVTLVWPDRAIKNTWVEISARPNERTGLSAPDVFYYGNLAGDTSGTGVRNAEFINALDLAEMKRVMAFYGSRTVPIEASGDHNRDGRVNALDLAVIKQNMNAAIPFFNPRMSMTTTAAAPAAREVLADGGATDLLD